MSRMKKISTLLLLVFVTLSTYSQRSSIPVWEPINDKSFEVVREVFKYDDTFPTNYKEVEKKCD
jgi:hypothetical protein